MQIDVDVMGTFVYRCMDHGSRITTVIWNYQKCSGNRTSLLIYDGDLFQDCTTSTSTTSKDDISLMYFVPASAI